MWKWKRNWTKKSNEHEKRKIVVWMETKKPRSIFTFHVRNNNTLDECIWYTVLSCYRFVVWRLYIESCTNNVLQFHISIVEYTKYIEQSISYFSTYFSCVFYDTITISYLPHCHHTDTSNIRATGYSLSERITKSAKLWESNGKKNMEMFRSFSVYGENHNSVVKCIRFISFSTRGNINRNKYVYSIQIVVNFVADVDRRQLNHSLATGNR